MIVYGHLCDFYERTTAYQAAVNMQAGNDIPYGWLGFYQERGENVSAIGSHREWIQRLYCGWEWRCQPMPARPPEHPVPWELCGWTWLCHWAWDNATIADTFSYAGRHLEMEIVNNTSVESLDLGTFNILECRTYGTPGTWFALCVYWGFATKIADNAYKIF